MAGDRLSQFQRKNRVTALGGAVLHYIFPLLLVFVLLLFGPRLAHGVVDGLGIRRPGKAVDVLFPLRDWKGLAAPGRDQVDLARVLLRVGIGIVVLVCRVLALRQESDPLSVGGPLRVGIVAGL